MMIIVAINGMTTDIVSHRVVLEQTTTLECTMTTRETTIEGIAKPTTTIEDTEMTIATEAGKMTMEGRGVVDVIQDLAVQGKMPESPPIL